ncbi:hypothetical protein GWI33_007401 [Rhynchophorus ferrugineus]|uniref:Uncharacterized protein n=1 Tax=Rhynchophorus ferrugineus TaxID=354439 RepID=A0A834MMM9_RHYFE|nr:hypothetical protein GWI33_007401 [Rhynchophorus ferrugineus]
MMVEHFIVEICIYSNRVVDVLYEKCCCQLECCLEDFFNTNTNAIGQFGSVYLAEYTQRKMLFCFDPYFRGADGMCMPVYQCIPTLSLIELMTHNFDNKNTVFKLHALKVCKIHRDPGSDPEMFAELMKQLLYEYERDESKKRRKKFEEDRKADVER